MIIYYDEWVSWFRYDDLKGEQGRKEIGNERDSDSRKEHFEILKGFYNSVIAMIFLEIDIVILYELWGEPPEADVIIIHYVVADLRWAICNE